MCISGLLIETPQSFWMQLSIHTNYKLAVNNDNMIICTKLLTIQQLLGHIYGERQWRINDFSTCKQRNWEAICLLMSITNVSAVFIRKGESDIVTAHSVNERQWRVNDFWSCK